MAGSWTSTAPSIIDSWKSAWSPSGIHVYGGSGAGAYDWWGKVTFSAARKTGGGIAIKAVFQIRNDSQNWNSQNGNVIARCKLSTEGSYVNSSRFSGATARLSASWVTLGTSYYVNDDAPEGTVTLNVSYQASSASWSNKTVTIGGLTTFTITMNSNDGTGEIETETKYQTIPIEIPECPFNRQGYAFTEWNTAADGSGTAYAVGDSYSTDADLVLYAQWKALSIMHYNNNGTEVTVTEIYANVSGTKVQVLGVYRNNNGVAEQTL